MQNISSILSKWLEYKNDVLDYSKVSVEQFKIDVLHCIKNHLYHDFMDSISIFPIVK